MTISDQNRARIDALLALTDHDWDMLRAHRPELLERLRRALRAEGRPSPEGEEGSTVIDLCASLAAAISLLERGGKAAKKAAPSDKMFDQMLDDYRASLERARAALSTPSPERAAPAAEPVAWAYEYTNHLKGDRAPGGWLRAVAFEPPTRARIEGGFARNIRALYASPDAILAKLSSPGEEGR